MSLRPELEGLEPRRLIEAVAMRIYEPSFLDVRPRVLSVPSALRVVILIIDFDTEVTMQGILGFLENSTGLYFAETIEAFDLIKAQATSDTLRRISAILEANLVSPEQLRADLSDLTPYAITSFAKAHGDLGDLPEDVESEAEKLYLHAETGSGEDIWALLDSYVAANRQGLLADLALVEEH
jgi:hypothetical protein